MSEKEEQGNNTKNLDGGQDFSAAYESSVDKSVDPVVFHSAKKINIIGIASSKYKHFDPEQLGKPVLVKDENRMKEIKMK